MADNPPINYSDTLYSLATFRETFGSLAIPARTTGEMALPPGEHKLSEKDVGVLVKWLQRDRGVICTDGAVSCCDIFGMPS
jgi:charged multivesicular body protein 7